MLVEACLLVALTLFLTLYQYLRRRWNVLKEWNIPHEPPTLRKIGHAALMLGKDVVKYEFQCKKKFGNIWGYYMFTRPLIIVHDPEIIRQIMITDFSNFSNRYKTRGDFGIKAAEEGMLVARPKEWKRMRTAISPTFSNVKLKAMSGMVKTCIENALTRIEQENSSSSTNGMDIKDLFNRISLDVICSVVFSVDVNSQDKSKPDPEIAKQANKFFALGLIDQLFLSLKLSFPFLGNYLGDANRRQPVKYFTNLCRKMIEKCKRDSSSHRPDIMHAMVSALKTLEEIQRWKKGLSEGEIIGNAATMLLAGYDSTAVAMTYLAYNLAVHMDVQKKLQAEIDKAIPDDDEVTYDAVTNLKYLDMCLNESMRLYSPIGRTTRCSSREMTIGDIKIPKGVVYSIPIASLSRDPELWDQPMLYNPERMRDMRSIDPVIFQPFGAGPRNCVGIKLSFMEIKWAFCAILKKYTFKPTEKTPKPPLVLKQFTTTSPTEDIQLLLSPRKVL